MILEALGPDFPVGLVGLVEARDTIDELLALDDLIDLVIPRGSNALVRYIQDHTRIPVMGHAEGVCHVYVDGAVDLLQAIPVILDAKTDYPSACTAMETLLLHDDLVRRPRARGRGIVVAGPRGGRAANVMAVACVRPVRMQTAARPRTAVPT